MGTSAVIHQYRVEEDVGYQPVIHRNEIDVGYQPVIHHDVGTECGSNTSEKRYRHE